MEQTQDNQQDRGEFVGKVEYYEVPKKHVPVVSVGNRIRIAKLYDSTDEFMYKIIKIGGWARSVREGKEVCFVTLTDGSSQQDLQVVISNTIATYDEINASNIGTSFSFVGTLIKSPAKGQPFELQVNDAGKHQGQIIGKCDAGKYPLSKKKHSLEFLRENAHLRPRTNLGGAVARVRNNMAYATHLFFQQRGYLYIHTPIITASDCEGAGEMFQVTTLLPEPHQTIAHIKTVEDAAEEEEKAVADKKKVDESKAEKGSKQQEKKEKKKQELEQKKQQKKQEKGQSKEQTEAGTEEKKDQKQQQQQKKEKKVLTEQEKEELKKKQQEKQAALQKTKEEEKKQQEEHKQEEEKHAQVEEQEAKEHVKEHIPFELRHVNYKKEILGKPAFLTVSGQLNVEIYACALTDCYTFGPTFRAENSHTSRHLSEFWMIEPELVFATLEDNMECAESYLKFCLQYALTNNRAEIEFFDKQVENGLIERLQKVIDTPFQRVEYTEGVRILEEHIAQKKVKFVNKVFWGVDLASEHEKYLTETVFQGPIILYNYPKDIKAFYMKMNADGKTVQAMDILVPRIGELIGGSAREEDLEKLDQRIEECKLDIKAYWWYRSLREYGTVPHAGFGLGFERLVMMVTGIENIRDVIPFPRAPGQAEF